MHGTPPPAPSWLVKVRAYYAGGSGIGMREKDLIPLIALFTHPRHIQRHCESYLCTLIKLNTKYQNIDIVCMYRVVGTGIFSNLELGGVLSAISAVRVRRELGGVISLIGAIRFLEGLTVTPTFYLTSRGRSPPERKHRQHSTRRTRTQRRISMMEPKDTERRRSRREKGGYRVERRTAR